jgi:MSHA biogenesis protein MshJ
MTAALDWLFSRWYRWQCRFDERSLRERALVVAALLAVVVFAADHLALAPLQNNWSAQRHHASVAIQALQQRQSEIAAQAAQALAADLQQRRDLSTWRERVEQGDAALRQLGGNLVSANEMVAVLQAVIDRSKGLKLRSLQSMAPTAVGSNAGFAIPAIPAIPAKPVKGQLYRHGVEIAVEGSFADLLAYCAALETLPQHLLWGGMKLAADKHPQIVLTLRLYTLSVDRNWLEL